MTDISRRGLFRKFGGLAAGGAAVAVAGKVAAKDKSAESTEVVATDDLPGDTWEYARFGETVVSASETVYLSPPIYALTATTVDSTVPVIRNNQRRRK